MLFTRRYRHLFTSKLWVATLIVLALSFTSLAATNPFAEVPADHWSYYALDRMESLGLIDRPGDSKTRLTWRLTRVEMALEVANIVDKLRQVTDEARVSLSPRIIQQSPESLVELYNTKVAPEQSLLDGDVRLLQDLITHFRPELEAVGYRFGSTPFQNPVGLDALARALGRYKVEGESLLDRNEPIRSDTSSSFPGLMSPTAQGELTLRMGPLDRQRFDAVVVLPGSTAGLSDEGPVLYALNPVFPDHRATIYPRLEELAGNNWDDLALISADGLEGMQAGVKLGQLGSTVLFARRNTDTAVDHMTGLDSMVQLDRFSVGATVLSTSAIVENDTLSVTEEGTLASVQGSYQLAPGSVVTAGLASSIWDDQDAALLRVGGVVQLSETLSLEAIYRLQSAGFRRALASDPDPERTGLDLVLDWAFDLGNTRWTAGVDRATWMEPDKNTVRTTASLGVLYPVNELTIVRASLEEMHQEGDLGPDDSERSYTTELGIDLTIPTINMNVSLGYALVEKWGEPSNPRSTGRTSEAALGLEYQLPSGSIALRYKVMDISGDVGESGEPQGPDVGATFTIRF